MGKRVSSRSGGEPQDLAERLYDFGATLWMLLCDVDYNGENLALDVCCKPFFLCVCHQNVEAVLAGDLDRNAESFFRCCS